MTCYAFIAAWFMRWNDAMLLEYLQWVNAKCIAFFFFSIFFPLCSFVNFSNLHRGSSNITPFSLFSLWSKWPFFQNKTSFSQSDQHYFLFFSPSSKHFFLHKNLYSMAVAPLFKSFSPFSESFPIFRVHDASSLRTLTPFVF